MIRTISSYLLPMFLRNFTKKHTNIELIINEITTDEIISGLEKGYLDIETIALRSSIENFVKECVFYAQFVVFVPADHKLMNKSKINQDDLDVSDFLLQNENHYLRDQALPICKIPENHLVWKNNKVIFESGNLETLIKLVMQKFGMTLLPFLANTYIKERNKNNQLKEFNDPVPKREVGFIYSNTFVKKYFLNEIKKEILKVIPADFKENKIGLVIH